MSFPEQNQTIKCDVHTCQHHTGEGKCNLGSIKVAPRQGYNSGKCDESECASYHNK